MRLVRVQVQVQVVIPIPRTYRTRYKQQLQNDSKLTTISGVFHPTNRRVSIITSTTPTNAASTAAILARKLLQTLPGPRATSDFPRFQTTQKGYNNSSSTEGFVVTLWPL